MGASILWASPFGPLRFDYAFPLAKADWGQDPRIQFRHQHQFRPERSGNETGANRLPVFLSNVIWLVVELKIPGCEAILIWKAALSRFHGKTKHSRMNKLQIGNEVRRKS
ncbi:MAG: BamA/TamA family outer membrane protein [Nitratireductor sp.]